MGSDKDNLKHSYAPPGPLKGEAGSRPPTPEGESAAQEITYTDFIDTLEYLEDNNWRAASTQSAVGHTERVSFTMALSDIMEAVIAAIAEATPILYKDGRYQKPTLINFKWISLGRIALKMIIAVVRAVKNK